MFLLQLWRDARQVGVPEVILSLWRVLDLMEVVQVKKVQVPVPEVICKTAAAAAIDGISGTQ
jgi:hypothetical protein